MRAPRQTSVSATLASPGEGALSRVGVRRPAEVPGLWSLWSSALPSSEELYPAKPSAPIPERLSDPPASHRYIDHFGIAWSRLGSNGQQPAEPVTACPAGQLNPGAIAGHFRERPRRDLGARSTARADAAPLATNRPRSEAGQEQGFPVNAPAGSRTWIYRLGGGRLIHWTTRARPMSPQGLAKATGACYVRR